MYFLEEGGSGGSGGTEAVLNGADRRCIEFREEALEDLDSRTEKGDWAVAWALVCGLARFEEWDDCGCLPDCWNVRMIVRHVVGTGEEAYAVGTQVF